MWFFHLENHESVLYYKWKKMKGASTMKETKYAGTQTEKNLMTAFAGESEARNKYTYFASKAKKEGYEQIAALFLKTADNEKEHAKLWFKELNGIGDTAENLLSAAEGENYEWTDMYDGFAKTADNEKEHAKLWFKELNGIGDTAENLLSAAKGENYEWTGCAGIQLRQFDPQFLLRVPAGLSVL